MIDPGRRGRPTQRNRRSRRTELLAGYWFLTIAVALLGPILAVVIYLIDHASGDAGLLPVLIISPDSARTILGSVAGSLITIASLTASLTIVTLQLLSNQYTPRAVRGFLRRQVAQVVSGTFIGIFLYCLLLLVTVRNPGDENDPFVPSLGVLMSVLLALFGLIMLVVFIHTLAKTIQVSCMTADLGRATLAALDVAHPDPYAGDRSAESAAGGGGGGGGGGGRGHAHRTGYVQWVDPEAVVAALRPNGGRFDVLVRSGDFVTRDDVVARWDGSDVARLDLRSLMSIGHERDIDQDPGFGIRQLVDIALRAISPGINDPTTAVTCLRYLRGVLARAAVRDLPARRLTTRDGVTVSTRGWTFADYLLPMAEIARYAVTDARVTVEMLGVLASTYDACREVEATERALFVSRLAADLVQPCLDAAATDGDRGALRAALARCGAGEANAADEAVEVTAI